MSRHLGPKGPEGPNDFCMGVRDLSAPKSQRFLRFAIAMPIAVPRNRRDFREKRKAMLHCDLRVRRKVASDLRFRAAISGPKTPSFCGISGDLAQSTRKSLAIAIVRFWCAKSGMSQDSLGFFMDDLSKHVLQRKSQRQKPRKNQTDSGGSKVNILKIPVLLTIQIHVGTAGALCMFGH